MKDLDKFIKECNLVFTNTIGRLEFCQTDFDLDKTEVKFDDCISLFNLVALFNEFYVKFKKEYDELEKLNLGDKIEIINYGKFTLDNDNYRSLILYVDNPTVTNHPDTILYLREINGEIKPFVTNNKNVFDKYYYRENIELDSDIVRKYLDLFEKYSLLLETYNYLKSNQIFGDKSNYIHTVIDGNFLDGLNKFKMIFGSIDFYYAYHVILVMNLGTDFGIDYENCKIKLGKKLHDITTTDFEDIFKRVFINKKYLSDTK